MKNSSKLKILNFLLEDKKSELNNKGLTIKQARNFFKIKNVAGRIYDLRENGWPIYTKFSETGKQIYKMGEIPSELENIRNEEIFSKIKRTVLVGKNTRFAPL